MESTLCKKLNDVSVQVVLLQEGWNITRGFMVLSKGVQIATLYNLDACMVECNSAFVESKKRALDSSSSPANQVLKRIVASTSDGHAFWVPKGVNSLDMKLRKEDNVMPPIT